MNSTAPVTASGSDNEPVIPGIPAQRTSSPQSRLRRPGPLSRAMRRDRRLTRQINAALYTVQPGLARRLREEREANWAAYDATAA